MVGGRLDTKTQKEIIQKRNHHWWLNEQQRVKINMITTKTNNTKTKLAFVLPFLGLALVGCSDTPHHNQLLSKTVNEHNLIVTDLSQVNFNKGEKCFSHSQEIVTIKDLQTTHPKPIYKLIQHEIKCSPDLIEK